MLEVKFCDAVEDSRLKFAVIIARSNGKWVFCKHRERDTYEIPGGHRELGERILDTARRELMEETAAASFEIRPVCVYSVTGKTRVNETGEETFGMLYYAEITRFGDRLDSEMEQVILSDDLPTNWTYPLIQPKLIEEAKRRNVFSARRILYGTGNPAKLSAMRRRLSTLGIEIIGLNDLGMPIPDVAEDGKNPLENAEKKAAAYYKAFRMPVFSCDSGLYLDGIPEEEQPGTHVRTVAGKRLSDDEMIAHYAGLAKKYGDLTARYKNAICLVIDDGHMYQAMEESMESEPFLITSVPHPDRKEGFPLDSLSIHIRTGKYYYDLDPGELDQVAVEDGFLSFFRRYFIEN